jgi:hypothetical protein
MTHWAPFSFIPNAAPRLRLKVANDDHDTLAIQAYLGHRSIMSTVRYTALTPTRFKNFWNPALACSVLLDSCPAADLRSLASRLAGEPHCPASALRPLLLRFHRLRPRTSVGAGGKSLRVKPYYLCHGRLGRAAQLLAQKQCSYDASERRRAEDPI